MTIRVDNSCGETVSKDFFQFCYPGRVSRIVFYKVVSLEEY